jgi:hypothetical protein
VLENFKNFAYQQLLVKTNRGEIKLSEVNEEDIVKDGLNYLVEKLDRRNKIYGRNDDNCAFRSEDAFNFLKLIINDSFFHVIEYQSDENFKLSE